MNHDGSAIDIDIAKDIALHDMLVASGHMTPLEHQATPIGSGPPWSSANFHGWKQYRKTVPNEVRHFDYKKAQRDQGRS